MELVLFSNSPAMARVFRQCYCFDNTFAGRRHLVVDLHTSRRRRGPWLDLCVWLYWDLGYVQRRDRHITSGHSSYSASVLCLTWLQLLLDTPWSLSTARYLPSLRWCWYEDRMACHPLSSAVTHKACCCSYCCFLLNGTSSNW